MTGIQPSSHGIVVESKENGVHFAISDKNFNSKIHRKVRDLRAGETVRGYKPRRKESLQDAVEAQGGTQAPGDAAKSVEDDPSSVQQDASGDQTEGATNGTQEKKGK